ncbi:MAG: hypothetical protein WC359_15420, partial [Dehalococcoidia bacterium]
GGDMKRYIEIDGERVEFDNAHKCPAFGREGCEGEDSVCHHPKHPNRDKDNVWYPECHYHFDWVDGDFTAISPANCPARIAEEKR